MPEDPNLTADAGQVHDPTPPDAPDSDSAAASSTEAPQPTVEEMQERIARLEANYKGSTKEWQREKTERERLAAQNDLLIRQQSAFQPQYQEAPAPRQIDPDIRRGYERLYKSILDGDQEGGAAVLEEISRRPLQQVGQMMQQAAMYQGRQQSLGAYLDGRGIKPGTDVYRETSERIEKAKNDPRYGFVTDPNSLAAIIASEVIAERAGNMGAAKEKARNDQVDAAFTEGSGKGNLPGAPKATSEKMFFTSEDLRMIRHSRTADGISEEEARKKYWNHLQPHIRQARKDAGRA